MPRNKVKVEEKHRKCIVFKDVLVAVLKGIAALDGGIV